MMNEEENEVIEKRVRRLVCCKPSINCRSLLVSWEPAPAAAVQDVVARSTQDIRYANCTGNIRRQCHTIDRVNHTEGRGQWFG